MTDATPQMSRRDLIRYFAALMAGLTSVAYYLIGFQLVTVLEKPEDQTAFGMIAGSAFLIGTLLIVFFDRRLVMGLGALAQMFIIFMYFNLAPEREPSFEFWGILIRVFQVLLLVALAYLAVTQKQSSPVPESPPLDRVGAG